MVTGQQVRRMLMLVTMREASEKAAAKDPQTACRYRKLGRLPSSVANRRPPKRKAAEWASAQTPASQTERSTMAGLRGLELYHSLLMPATGTETI